MDAFERQIQRFAEMYRDAERVILRQIQQLDALDYSGDVAKRLARVNKLETETKLELAKLTKMAKAWSGKNITAGYEGGVQRAQGEIKKVTGKVVAGFDGFHAPALATMKNQTLSRIADVSTVAGRRTLDVYNEAKLGVHMFDAVAGIESVTKLSRRLRDEMLEKGITGFIDKAGREWNIARYTEMLARTTLMNAQNEAKWNELLHRGHDLVRVSSHSTICEKCKPWEGAILSISGRNREYRSIADAKAAGLFHPNCAHVAGLYREIGKASRKLKEPEPEDPKARENPKAKDDIEPTQEVTVLNAKTLKEAASQAVEYGIAKKADFKGLDVSVANEINNGILRAKALFPELEPFDFVGSIQQHNKAAYELDIERWVERNRRRFKGMTEEELREYAKMRVKRYRTNSDVWAIHWPKDGVAGISVNNIWGSPKSLDRFKANLKADSESGFHPVGCDTVKSVVDHEMGHKIDHLVAASQDKEIVALYEKLKNDKIIKISLSMYAEKEGIQEFIAEAWAECQNNSTPRPVALQVAERLITLGKEKRK